MKHDANDLWALAVILLVAALFVHALVAELVSLSRPERIVAPDKVQTRDGRIYTVLEYAP